MKHLLFISLLAGLAFSALAQPAETTASGQARETGVSATAPAANAPDKGISFNFRNATLESVLVHMSEAAGYSIVVDPQMSLRGRITVIAAQPVDREGAYKLLEGALTQGGYAISRDGRNLSIKTKAFGIKDTEIIPSNVPAAQIPKTSRLVTQLVTVKQANAAQLVQDLIPLLNDDVIMTANLAGNCLFVTATEAEVKRVAELVEAIDGSISNTTTLKVIPLRYADATTVATLITGLFGATTSQRGGGAGGQGGGQGFGGGGGQGVLLNNLFNGGGGFGGGGRGAN